MSSYWGDEGSGLRPFTPFPHLHAGENGYLGPGQPPNILRRRSHGQAPAPAVNFYNDFAVDVHPPYNPMPAPLPLPAVYPRPDYSDWMLLDLRQKERELAEIAQRQKREDERKQWEMTFKAEEEERKASEKRVIEKYERGLQADSENYKAQEKEILERLVREQREAKEKENREFDEFLRKQKEMENEEKEEKERKEQEFEEKMRRRFARQGFTPAEIDRLVQDEPTTTTTTKAMDLQRPYRYVKIHRAYMSVETLKFYSLPYGYDRSDPDYIIIMREMTKSQTDELMEHTRRLRSSKLLLLEPPKDKKQYAFYRKRDRSTSRVKQAGILKLDS